MPLIAMQDGGIVLRAGAVGTEGACCCGTPGATCYGGICSSAGTLCTSTSYPAPFRYVHLVFEVDLTDPCEYPISPIDANGDCNHTWHTGFNQMDFACDSGANDNKTKVLYYHTTELTFVSYVGGLAPKLTWWLGCASSRLRLWFGEFAYQTRLYSLCEDQATNWIDFNRCCVDFGPMPANCNDIDGLTASGTMYWLRTNGNGLTDTVFGGGSCHASRPFTVTISTGFNAVIASSHGCE